MRKHLFVLIQIFVLTNSCSTHFTSKNDVLTTIDSTSSIQFQKVKIHPDYSLWLNNYSLNEKDTTQKEFTNILIPDHETAARIAFIYLTSYYGRDIYNEFPIKVDSLGQLWIITGTPHTEKGGVAHLAIRKSDGRVVKIFHDK
jgi:hypothetical protein